MPGGIMNLLGVGQPNLMVNGNPKKTFWKSSYNKYTNFGMQRFRLDYNGSKKLRLNDESTFTFKFPRYADLVLDSYLVVNLPNIWSPLFPIQDNYNTSGDSNADASHIFENNTYYIPYEFKWIDNIGISLIKEIEVTVGGMVLQRYSGDYLLSMIKRDFSGDKKKFIDEMTGNIKKYNDPANSEANILKQYPNAVYEPSAGGAEPSIRGGKLFIPLNIWFGLSSKQAFPLVSLQYNELHVNVTCRSIKELIRIRDVKNPYDNYPFKAPNFNEPSDQLYRFLQTPPGIELNYNDIIDKFAVENNIDANIYNEINTLLNADDITYGPDEEINNLVDLINDISTQTTMRPPKTSSEFYNSYIDKRNEWDADVHLLATYVFLSDDERRIFASKDQEYIIKDVHEKEFHNIVNTSKLSLESTGMVVSWMWFARRNDAYLRNEWSNYTNWKFKENINVVRIPTKNHTSKQPWYYTNTNTCESTNPASEPYTGAGYKNSKLVNALNTDIVEVDNANSNRFIPYSNQFVSLPFVNPYANSNFNRYLRSHLYQMDPEDSYKQKSANTYIHQTQLDLPGYYPPSVDIICDTIRGPYIGVNELNKDNALGLLPVWPQQGSINTNFPIYAFDNCNEDTSLTSTIDIVSDLLQFEFIAYNISNSVSGNVWDANYKINDASFNFNGNGNFQVSDDSLYVDVSNSDNPLLEITYSTGSYIPDLTNENSNGITLEAWILYNPSSTSNTEVIKLMGFDTDDDDDGFYIELSPDFIGSSPISSTNNYVNNTIGGINNYESTLIHIVCTLNYKDANGYTRYTYVNGTQSKQLDTDEATEFSNKPNFATAPSIFNIVSNDTQKNIQLYSFRLWHKELNSAQVTKLYLLGAYYSLNDNVNILTNTTQNTANITDDDCIEATSAITNETIAITDSTNSIYVPSCELIYPLSIPPEYINSGDETTIPNIENSVKSIYNRSKYFGSPYQRTTFPAYWGTNNLLPSPFSTSGKFLVENEKKIILTAGIYIDGKERETTFESGLYEFIEKYQRSNGGADSEGLMCYNFCLNTSPFDLQPSGAMNLSKFSTIELEVTTTEPPIDNKAQFATICVPEVQPDGSIVTTQVGTNKQSWSIYLYTYDIHFMEERYNMVKFVGGNVGLMYAR